VGESGGHGHIGGASLTSADWGTGTCCQTQRAVVAPPARD